MSRVFAGCRTISSTGVSSVTVGNTLFVSKTGTDATGARQNFAKHYLTITAALAAASSGDMVEVFPGTYTENITCVTGVRIYCHPGVTINGKITVGNGTHYFMGRAIITASSDDAIYFTGNSSAVAYFEFHSCAGGTGWAVNKTGAGYLELSYFREISAISGGTGAIKTSAGTIHAFGQVVYHAAGYTGTDLILFDTGTAANQLQVDQITRTDESKRALYCKAGNARIYFRLCAGYVQYDAGQCVIAPFGGHGAIRAAEAVSTIAPLVIAGSALIVENMTLVSSTGTSGVAVYASAAKDVSLRKCAGNYPLHSNVTLVQASEFTYDSTLATGNP